MESRSDDSSGLKTLRTPLNSSLGFWAVVLLGMMVLLAAVAILQYRWSNEASRADEVRIGTELASLMMKWHSDLYGEFAAICNALQVGPDSGARDTWNDYLGRYVEWNNALPHESLPYVYRNPDLVGEIYIWETSRPASPGLFWLNLTEKRIEPLSPPPELSPLLSRLQATAGNLSIALNAWKLPGDPSVTVAAETRSTGILASSNSTGGWQFDENIPAMVHPILHHGDGRSLSSERPVDWIIITLDMTVLRKRVLPELSSRYFGGLDGLDYKVAVIRKGDSKEEIYASDAGFGIEQLNAADSTLNVFGFQPAAGSASLPRPSPPGSEWHNLTAPAWFPVIQYGARTDAWVLELQHRGGPLQLAIRKVRRNNLTLSGLVLFLLALSFAVLTFAGYRAQNFAKLQMDFVASISHELRTPLTAIFSAGENIKDGVVRKQDDLVRYGSIVTAQSRQLMNHVDRILAFASIRSGSDRYTLRPLEVRKILDAVRRNISALMTEESVVLEEKIEPGLPPVLGDWFAACGCLENLITNAIKYGGPDRKIYLSAELRRNPGERQEVAISVEDHGMGIDASELQQIFQPFYRAPAATAAQIHGTGLGLSLAKHFSEAMGGRLTVASHPGSGSIFTLYLQPAPEQNQNIPTERTEAVIR